MDPTATGLSYDQLAQHWQEKTPPSYGMTQLERAIQFTKQRGTALDIGCGSQGRFITLLLKEGFVTEGIDVSATMITLARENHPKVVFCQADFCTWDVPRKYDLITAWDSTWHLPLALQESYLKKVGDALNPGGVYLFTTAGLDEPAEKSNSDMGVPLAYGVLGIPRLLELLAELGFILRHLEYDQYPEMHLSVIAQKRSA